MNGREALAWGLATFVLGCGGQGGQGSPGGSDAAAADGGRRAIAIATGGFHTCALLSDGSVECWGLNADGQLGDGTMIDSLVPVAVKGARGVMAIAAGYDETCALLSGGNVECWGVNDFGQLGNGTTSNASVPVAVDGVTGAVAIACGFNHACALIGDGTVRCWGDGRSGELGNGTPAISSTPVVVSGLTDATALAQGSTAAQSCALLSGGGAACWGSNVFGDLGSGSTAIDSAIPLTVSNLTGATELASGNEHVCALLAGGSASCWGDNEWGQLGDGTSGEPSDARTPMVVMGLTGATELAAGLLHTCARMATGAVECWGLDLDGQLGHGTSGESNDSSIPVDVLGIRSATAISAGAYFACALIDGGQVECWGDNQYGELGDGTVERSSIPVLVSL
jgi:alpha-tubulin suppressor-like RCC1 family protein